MLFGFPVVESEEDREYQEKRRREIAREEHETRMTIINGIRDEKYGFLPKNNLLVKAVRSLNSRQKVGLLAKLEAKAGNILYHRHASYMPIACSCAKEAVEAFRRGSYRRKIIYRYIGAEDIAEIK